MVVKRYRWSSQTIPTPVNIKWRKWGCSLGSQRAFLWAKRRKNKLKQIPEPQFISCRKLGFRAPENSGPSRPKSTCHAARIREAPESTKLRPGLADRSATHTGTPHRRSVKPAKDRYTTSIQISELKSKLLKLTSLYNCYLIYKVISQQNKIK